MSVLAPVTDGKLTALATSSGTSVTATFPNSHVATLGNLLLAIWYVRTSSVPSGGPDASWTRFVNSAFNSQMRITAWCKVSDGTETGITSPTVAAVRQNMAIWEFPNKDVDAAALVAAAGSSVFSEVIDTGTSLTTKTSTAIDPPGTGDHYFICYTGFFGTTGNAGTPSTPFTKDLQDGINSGMASFLQANNPGSTTNTHTWTTAVNIQQLTLAVPGRLKSPPFFSPRVRPAMFRRR